MRVTTGGQLTVTATEFWLAEVNAGRAYSAGAVLLASAGNFNHVQLINPVASGVTITIRSLILASDVAAQAVVMSYDTALTNLFRNGKSLLRPNADGLGQLRYVQQAGQLGTTIVNNFVSPGGPISLVPDWWAILPAGTGILVTTTLVNVGISASFTWREA